MYISCLILFQNLITEMAGLFLTRLIRVDECLSLDYSQKHKFSVHTTHLVYVFAVFYIRPGSAMKEMKERNQKLVAFSENRTLNVPNTSFLAAVSVSSLLFNNTLPNNARNLTKHTTRTKG